MAEIDSLSIQIKASTHEAVSSIDKLIGTLGKLSGALNIRGIDGFVSSMDRIASSLNSINTDNVSKIATSMKELASAGKKISKIGDPFGGIIGSLRDLSTIQLSDTLKNINFIKDSVSKIGGESGQRASAAIRDIAASLPLLNIPIPEIGNELLTLASGLRALGSGNIVTASQTLPYLAEGLREINAAGTGLTADTEAILNLATAVKQFGYAKVEKSIVNLPVLTTELRKMIETLSQAPEVSQNTVELVKAIASLNVGANQLSQSSRRAGKGLEFFTKHAKKAHTATFSLAATIGKIYATYWAIFRLVGMFKKSIDLSSDLTETQNVVDHVFGDMKYRMEDFAKTAVETVGMSELTAKKIGSQFQAMGHNMGIAETEIKRTNGFLQEATKLADGSGKAYANVAESMADVSINLTKLTGDMASFYNMDYEEVAEKMQAVFTGQTKPLRSFGLDLTMASLKSFALANGLNADIKNMTQAEKTMLRYQYVMANTTAAHGDFARTINTWANQIKLAKENIRRLQIVLGQIGVYTFKPLVMNFNTAMNDIIHLAESTFNSLGTIFGWQLDITDVGIVDDMADGLEDVEDGFEGAGKEAKKFKNFLLGIDELNLLPDNDDKDNGSGVGDSFAAMASGLQDSSATIRKTESAFDSIYDTLYKLGARIAEVQKEWLKNIKWDEVFEKAESIGKGLASFLNGYLADAELFYEKGRFIANGINTVSHEIYGFFHEFDGYQLGTDIGFELNGITNNLDWGIIKSAAYEMAHDFTETINGFFKNTNWKQLGHTIIEGVNTAVMFVSTIWNEIHWDVIGQSFADMINQMFTDWDYQEAARLFKGKIQAVLDLANNFLSSTDFVMIGQKIGKFLAELNLAEYVDDIAMLIWNIIKAAFDMLPTIFQEAPIESALLLAFGWMKFSGLSVIGGNIASGIMGGFGSKLAGILTADLNAISIAGATGTLYAATALGAAIASAILAGIAGLDWGVEIGKAIFPEDAMWYDEFKQGISEFIYRKFGDLATEFKLNENGKDYHTGKRMNDTETAVHNRQVNNAIQSNQRLALAVEHGAMSADEAKEAYENMGHATVFVRKNADEATNSVNNLSTTATNAASATDKVTTAFNAGAAALVGGRTNFTNTAHSMELLHTNLLSSKTGLDALISAFDVMGEKKDKTKSISDTFENVKSKANEVAGLFSQDKFANMFSAIPEAFALAWRDALTVMQEMWAQMAKWINENAKIEIPKTKVGKNEIGGGTVQLKVPKFDVGGSIPNNGQLFVANESGAEVVANMGRSTGVMNTDQMEAAIANGMMKALAASGQTVQVVLNGDASTFFTAMVRENNSSIMRTGSSPLRV